MRTLTTTTEVIAALGGATKLSRMLGISYKTVHGWTRPGWTISSKYREVMVEMLSTLDAPCEAPGSLWGMVEAKPADTEAA